MAKTAQMTQCTFYDRTGTALVRCQEPAGYVVEELEGGRVDRHVCAAHATRTRLLIEAGKLAHDYRIRSL